MSPDQSICIGFWMLTSGNTKGNEASAKSIKNGTRTWYGYRSKYMKNYRYFCIPSVASEGSPLMETVNFTPFFSPN